LLAAAASTTGFARNRGEVDPEDGEAARVRECHEEVSGMVR
jgi:hypothetical protein